MGKPGRIHILSLCTEYIGTQSERGELKHLSTCRSRNQFRDSVSSGERTRKSPNRVIYCPGLKDPEMGFMMDSRKVWKGLP